MNVAELLDPEDIDLEKNSFIEMNKVTFDFLKYQYGNLFKEINNDLFIPIVITGKSGVGKDTIVDALIPLLKDEFKIDIERTKSRFLSREQRPGEEDSENNFVSKDDFENRGLTYNYEFDGKRYGIDDEILKKEKTVFIVNFSDTVDGLIHYLIQKYDVEPFVINLEMESVYNIKNLQNREGSEEERIKRIAKVNRGGRVHEFRNLSFVKDYIFDLKINRSLSDSELNDLYFESALLTITERLLGHIDRFNQRNIAGISAHEERVKKWVKHIHDRP